MFWNITSAPAFLTPEEIENIMQSVRANEKNTSGEIRICIESKCAYMDPLHRAQEIFQELKMYNTANRNAVLIYIAYLDRDFCLFGDKAIYEKTSPNFWYTESRKLGLAFYEKQFVKGLIRCIEQIGAELTQHFPHHGENKNELPDEIVFGK